MPSKTSRSNASKRKAAARVLSHLQTKPLTPSDTIWPQLDDYQRSVVEMAIKRKTLAAFAEQGTGKTWITAGVIERLRPSMSLLVVPLENIETTWQELLAKHFNVVRSLDDALAWQKAWAVPCVLLLHYQAINPKLLKRLRRVRWDLIVYDESQRLKDRGSRLSRNAALLSASGEYRLALSGTPMDRQPNDLWAQFRFIRPSLLGTWKEFEDRYLEPINIDLSKYKKGTVMWHRAMKRRMIALRRRPFNQAMMPQLVDTLRPYCVRVTKEVLNLKPVDFRVHPIILRGAHRAAYDAMDGRMVIDWANVTAQHAGTKRMKLRQICGGFVINDDGEVIHLGNAKLSRLTYLLRTLPKPVAVYCQFTHEIEAVASIARKQKWRTDTLTGADRKRRPDISRAFQAGKIDVLVAQTKAGGVGIDLFRASQGIAYSLSESFIDSDQVWARLHRRGQENTVTWHVLVVQDSVDSDQYKSLLSKSSATEHTLNHFKR
ncbi:MAG: DEAD/DEAH box helicase [Hyphomicrobiaceae bacterium]|nr:MAG: DEAD/DEAH box helicase [Hyphomicrobiaceae bacterium]